MNQELEYCDGIILLIGVKFAEIIKVGETIEDGLKTGKISHVAAHTESSILLKRREMMCLLFPAHQMEKDTLENPQLTKVILELNKIHI